MLKEIEGVEMVPNLSPKVGTMISDGVGYPGGERSFLIFEGLQPADWRIM